MGAIIDEKRAALVVLSFLAAIGGCAEASDASIDESSSSSSGSPKPMPGRTSSSGSRSSSDSASSSDDDSASSDNTSSSGRPSGSGTASSGGTNGDPSTPAGPVAKGSWAFGAEMPTPRRRLGVTRASDGRIFAIGGETNVGQARTTIVEIYDPSANSWSRGPSLPATLPWSGAATGYDGKVYALSAGEDNFVLDRSKGRWTALAPTPSDMQRTAFALVPVGHTIAVVGGGAANNLVIYDIDTNTWSIGPKYREPLSGPGATLDSSGALVMVGGFRTSDGSLSSVPSVSRLPAGASAWQSGPSLPISVGLLAATTDSMGRVIAMGGQLGGYLKGGSFVANAYVLNGGAWSAVAPLSEPRISMGVCAGDDGKVYAIGGEAALPNKATSVVGTVEIFTP